jgi:hypothetical protein
MVSRLTIPVVYLSAVGLAIGAAPDCATDISWHTTAAQTASDGNHYTREGTAFFTTGEEADVVVNGFIGLDASKANGTARGEVHISVQRRLRLHAPLRIDLGRGTGTQRRHLRGRHRPFRRHCRQRHRDQRTTRHRSKGNGLDGHLRVATEVTCQGGRLTCL